MAGNQLGKTLSAGFEIAYHVTGLYPEWWEGRRFPGPTSWWVANTNNETTRDNPQRVLMGEHGQWGTGTIPRSCIAKKPTMARGFPDLIDVVQVKHASGGISSIQFKAYDQGWRKFQGATLSGGIWLDEEPDDIKLYNECLARIQARGGMILITETPLLGMSDVVNLFFPEPGERFRALVQMEIEEAEHYTQEEREIIIAGYAPHQRDARARGLPLMGGGKIFTAPQSQIEVEPFAVPAYWRHIGGMDFGWGDHPFAAAHLVHDNDRNRYFLVADFKEKEMSPANHASALKHWGKGQLRWAWPHDGNREWGTSGPLKDVYADEGLKMLPQHATWKEGGFSANAAIELVIHWIANGQFKVFSSCPHFWQEYSTYHRDDNGQVVKKRDDLLDALFKAVMMLRFARPLGTGQPLGAVVEGADFDPFDWSDD